MKRITTLIVTALLFSACGNVEEDTQSEGLIIDKPCPPPVGTKYTQEVVKVDGTCPVELDEAFTSSKHLVVINGQDSCGTSTFQESETHDNGCKSTLRGQTMLTGDGPQNTTFTFTISCPGREPCESRYEAFYEER